MGKVILQTLQASDQQKTYSDKANYNFHLLADYINGVKTIKGDKGDQGLPGSTGRQGIQGERGKSIFVYDGTYPVEGSETYEQDLASYKAWVEENGITEGDVVWFEKENTFYKVGNDVESVPTEDVFDMDEKIDSSIKERDKGIKLWDYINTESPVFKSLSPKIYLDEDEISSGSFGGIVLNSSIYNNKDVFTNENLPKSYLTILVNSEVGNNNTDMSLNLYENSEISHTKGLVLGAFYQEDKTIEDINRSLVINYNPYRNTSNGNGENDFYEGTFVIAGDTYYNSSNCFSSGYRFIMAHGNTNDSNIDNNSIITFGDGRFVNKISYTDGHEDIEASDFDKSIYSSITFTKGDGTSGDSSKGGRFLIGTTYDGINVVPVIDIHNIGDNASDLKFSNSKLESGVTLSLGSSDINVTPYGNSNMNLNISVSGKTNVNSTSDILLNSNSTIKSTVTIDDVVKTNFLLTKDSISLKSDNILMGAGNVQVSYGPHYINLYIKDAISDIYKNKWYYNDNYVDETIGVLSHDYKELQITNSKYKNVLTLVKQHYNSTTSDKYDGTCFLKFSMPTVSAVKDGDTTGTEVNVGGWQGGFSSYIIDGEQEYKKNNKTIYNRYGLLLSAYELKLSANNGVIISNNTTLCNEYTSFTTPLRIDNCTNAGVRYYDITEERTTDETGGVVVSYYRTFSTLKMSYCDPYITTLNNVLTLYWDWSNLNQTDYSYQAASQKNTNGYKGDQCTTECVVVYKLKKKIPTNACGKTIEYYGVGKRTDDRWQISGSNSKYLGIKVFIGSGTYNTMSGVNAETTSYKSVKSFTLSDDEIAISYAMDAELLAKGGNAVIGIGIRCISIDLNQIDKNGNVYAIATNSGEEDASQDVKGSVKRIKF